MKGYFHSSGLKLPFRKKNLNIFQYYNVVILNFKRINVTKLFVMFHKLTKLKLMLDKVFITHVNLFI